SGAVAGAIRSRRSCIEIRDVDLRPNRYFAGAERLVVNVAHLPTHDVTAVVVLADHDELHRFALRRDLDILRDPRGAEVVMADDRVYTIEPRPSAYCEEPAEQPD
ncbi:MAG TPA: hypothetical protein VGI86_20440, partial [Acidimicrobiia bacterium]